MNEQLRRQIDEWIDQDLSEDEIVERLRTAGTLPAPGGDRGDGAGLSGAIRTVAQGATFGFGDELEGLVRGAAALAPGGRSPAEAYREGVEAARADIEQFREAHPVAAFALEAGGGLVTGGSGVVRSAGRALLRRGAQEAAEAAGRQAVGRLGSMLARPIATGAVEGAVAGAGAAEGGIGERVAGAIGGTVLGAGTGGAAQAVGGLVRGPMSRAGARLLAALERHGVRDVGAALRQLQPGETLMDLPAEAGRRLGRTVAGAGIGAATGAALDPEGSPTEGAIVGGVAGATVGRLSGAGTPLQRLARAAASIPSEGAEQIRRTLTERAEDAPARITGALQRRTGLSFEDAVQTVDDMIERRAAEAAPLYRAAYKKSVSDDVIRGLFEEPEFQKAYRLAQRTAQQEASARRALEAAGLPVPEDLADAEPLPQLFRVDENGRVEFLTKSIPVKALDYMKSALQEVVGQEIAGGRLTKRGAVQLQRKLEAFLSRVDDLVPEYRQARTAFAGHSRAIEAFELARRGSPEEGIQAFLNEDPRRIEKLLRDLPPSEQDFYRRGALDAVRQRLERAADERDLTRILFGNTDMRRRIRMLFRNEEDFQRFAEDMLRERRMAETTRFVLGGSPTARIHAEQQDLLGPNIDVGNLFRPADALGQLLRSGLAARIQQGFGERTVNELAPMLTATATEATRVQALLEAARRREALRNARLRALTAGGAVPLGLMVGRAAAPESNPR